MIVCGVDVNDYRLLFQKAYQRISCGRTERLQTLRRIDASQSNAELMIALVSHIYRVTIYNFCDCRSKTQRFGWRCKCDDDQGARKHAHQRIGQAALRDR
jgi:hypothetical protein